MATNIKKDNMLHLSCNEVVDQTCKNSSKVIECSSGVSNLGSPNKANSYIRLIQTFTLDLPKHVYVSLV